MARWRASPSFGILLAPGCSAPAPGYRPVEARAPLLVTREFHAPGERGGEDLGGTFTEYLGGALDDLVQGSFAPGNDEAAIRSREEEVCTASGTR